MKQTQATAATAPLWIVIGDLHGDAGRIARIPELEQAQGVIISGDLSRQGGLASARQVVETIWQYNPTVLAQIGNLDRPEVDNWLEQQGINLHNKVRELTPKVAVIGLGGSVFTPLGTPSEFPESCYAGWLTKLDQQAGAYEFVVLISHNPPYDTVCDRLHNGVHVGSRALRDYLEERQPQACICGHIHEARGSQLLGRTIVANPGAFAAGGYVVLRLGEHLEVDLRRLEADI